MTGVDIPYFTPCYILELKGSYKVMDEERTSNLNAPLPFGHLS
jgi:hypothetical protein